MCTTNDISTNTLTWRKGVRILAALETNWGRRCVNSPAPGNLNRFTEEAAMPTVHSPRPRVNPNRERKPPAPVAVTGAFEPGVMPHDLLHGCAILTITDAARQEVFYWTKALLDQGGRMVALDLQKFGRLPGEDHHRVTLDPLACD